MTGLDSLRSQEPERELARTHRDAALARVVRARRSLAAGAAVLTAGFATLAQAATPGRASSSRAQLRGAGAPPASPWTGAADGASQPMPAQQTPRELGLQPPAQPPKAAPAAPSTPGPVQSAPSDPARVQPSPTPAQPSPAPVQPAPPASSSGGSGGGSAVSGGS